MNDYTPYLKELVKENLQTLIEDNEEEIVKYLSLKGYHFKRPPKEVNDEYTFENAWNLYQKKVGSRANLNKKWNSMPKKDRKAATEYIPLYVLSTPDKQYRKNFQTFLNQRSWEDEIIGQVHAVIPQQDESDITKLIASTEEAIEKESSGMKRDDERRRIAELVKFVEANPASAARKSLENYYRRGYLQELGIQWLPNSLR